MGSRSIAKALENRFSAPSLQLETEEFARVEELAEKLLISSRPLWAHLLAKKVLAPPDQQYYTDTRAKRYGMSLDSYYTEHVSQQLWYQLDTMCREIGDALAETPGPFLMNYHPSYADFTVVALLRFFSCVDETMLDHFYSVEPQLLKLYDACHEWLERDF
ncbi:glutathione S-transferase [Fusarium beomiforme]|uniref:Glutathione S-transferase n=1 Tax=Fusarium beomiforme TaxID=44412 RepID=A0A9P5A6D7_9HYPO|nr:glutathione S-transferase [Fusarium beomiforme]